MPFPSIATGSVPLKSPPGMTLGALNVPPAERSDQSTPPLPAQTTVVLPVRSTATSSNAELTPGPKLCSGNGATHVGAADADPALANVTDPPTRHQP